MERESLLRKVKALLKLSQSPVEEEAKLALLKAQELMAKYNIEMSQLGQESNVVTREVTLSTKSVSPNASKLISKLAKHYRCEVIYCVKRDRTTRVEVIGYEHDAEAFVAVAEFAINAQDQLFKKYLKTQNTTGRSESIQMKNMYCMGFRTGMVDALNENENKYSLVVQVPTEVKNHLAKYDLGVLNQQQKMSHNPEHYAKGLSDGRAAQNNRNSLV